VWIDIGWRNYSGLQREPESSELPPTAAGAFYYIGMVGL